ncbi:hypothetical protein BDF20DRAFT_811471 [Mycotypha africana]|uniref:uncharacterized protein n=1 Tax=Mycotypha africana TaxID=64632 RepID=UPI002300125C|nr:uncharacterized protein BDF20DRAFT_811471 [Mycotypha africana]KAI8992112.1 hypothetical protein BDF20DRAFT_811471 [Mycotypha africana]
MSDANDNTGSEEDNALSYGHRTTHEEFQERLLRAQEQTRDEQLDVTDEAFLTYDEESLKKQLVKYKEQVERVEKRVQGMEQRLSKIRAKREKEAGLTNMTPEERAAYFEEEEKRAKREARKREKQRERLEAKTEYLLLLQSTPANDTNVLGGAEFIDPDSKLRQRAYVHDEVIRQTDYSCIKITSSKNIIESNADNNGE